MSFDRPETTPDDASGGGVRANPRAEIDWRDDADVEAATDTADETDAADDGTPSDETDDVEADEELDDTGVLYEDQVEPEYGILGFTLRELILVGAWLVGFIVSFFPIGPIGDTVWTTGIHWILMMGLPTAAVFLVVLRRLSPEGIRRVGSLGIDQFASVAASVAAVSWAQVLWQQVAATVATGALLIGWVAIVGQLAMLVLVAATVFAPLLPRLREDFRGRLETLAHRNANPVRPVISRPRPEREPAPAVDPAAAPHDDSIDDAGAADHAAPAGAEPRVETALTMVIPDGAAAPDARDRASASPAGQQPAAVPAPVASVPDPNLEAQPASERASAASTEPAPEDDDIEVLYNTAAVEALRDIFAVDETTNPRHPVEHNTAPDGIAGSDVHGGRPDDAVDVGTAADVAVESDAVTTAPDAVTAEPDAVTAEPDAATTVFDVDGEPLRRRSGSDQSAESGDLESGDTERRQPEPFWILAPTERDVLDEHGQPLFRVGPTAWALAIEDRGGAFVVRHEDGRIGYLHDISDITKG